MQQRPHGDPRVVHRSPSKITLDQVAWWIGQNIFGSDLRGIPHLISRTFGRCRERSCPLTFAFEHQNPHLTPKPVLGILSITETTSPLKPVAELQTDEDRNTILREPVVHRLWRCAIPGDTKGLMWQNSPALTLAHQSRIDHSIEIYQFRPSVAFAAALQASEEAVAPFPGRIAKRWHTRH
jgi:hypothetical protein